MKKLFNGFLWILSIILLFSPLSNKAQDQKPFTFGMHPSLGFTYTNSSQATSENENIQWLLSLPANFNYAGKNFQFDSDVFLQYGQIVKANQHPQKTQDNLILNLMPSIRLLKKPGIRLFWQTKVETQIKEGILNNQKTGFLDPGFLTHTLFIGNKNQLITQTEKQTFQIVYGVGYSYQQVIRNHFQLLSETQPNSNNNKNIMGSTAVFNLGYMQKFNRLMSMDLAFNSLLLAKKDFFKNNSNSRFTSLLLANLNIGMFSLQYTNNLVYDKEISFKRQLDHTLVLAVKFSI
jgi:hypothetical protein